MYRRVPVEFLSDEFVSGYGRFVGERLRGSCLAGAGWTTLIGN